MTQNQVSWLNVLYNVEETRRHNQAVERENVRHNVQSEVLDRYRTDTQAKTSIYSADKNYAGTVYSADRHYAGTKYSADVNAATQKYATDVNATTQRYVANLNANTQRYVADKSYAGTVYSANRHYDATKYSADKNYAGTVYSADKHYAGTVYSANRNYNASVYATDASLIRANMEQQNKYDIANRDRAERQYEAQLKANVDRYKANLTYDSSLAATQQKEVDSVRNYKINKQANRIKQYGNVVNEERNAITREGNWASALSKLLGAAL